MELDQADPEFVSQSLTLFPSAVTKKPSFLDFDQPTVIYRCSPQQTRTQVVGQYGIRIQTGGVLRELMGQGIGFHILWNGFGR